MRGVTAAIVLCGGLMTATGAKAEPPGSPDLTQCPRLPREEPMNDRTKPLPVPQAYQMLIASSRQQYAVATIYGGTVCVDTRPMTQVNTFTLSRDRRFLEFDWDGYEAFGHVVVDRTGKGQVIDTGVSPTSSPSGRLFAAVQQTEAVFGSLEGFGVWQVGVVGVRQLTLQEDIPRMADWRIDGWAGDGCINLSGIPYERITDPKAKLAKFPRDRYVARPVGQGWVLTPSTTGCPAVKPAK